MLAVEALAEALTEALTEAEAVAVAVAVALAEAVVVVLTGVLALTVALGLYAILIMSVTSSMAKILWLQSKRDILSMNSRPPLSIPIFS